MDDWLSNRRQKQRKSLPVSTIYTLFIKLDFTYFRSFSRSYAFLFFLLKNQRDSFEGHRTSRDLPRNFVDGRFHSPIRSKYNPGSKPPPSTPLTQLPNNFPQWVHWRYSKYFPHWLTDWFVASWTRLASRGKKHRSSNSNNKKLINILIYVSQFRRFYYINKNVPGPSAGGWRRLGVISGFAEGGTEPCWQLKWSFYDDVSHGYCNEVVLG